jgi:hypothetical protein
MGSERPVPPRPGLQRRPPRSFGWINARMLKEDWLSRLGPHGTAVLAFLAIAADGEGASFYLRETMAMKIGLDRRELDRCLERLLELELVALRPWSAGRADGVWQVLPMPRGGG